jgi:hypothetical protein
MKIERWSIMHLSFLLMVFALGPGAAGTWAAGPSDADQSRRNSGTDELPQSKDDLFGDLPAAPAAAPPAKKDDLFDTVPVVAAKPAETPPRRRPMHGYLEEELARTTVAPVHWTKMLTRLDVVGQGAASAAVKWKLGLRADYDAVFSAYRDNYPFDVRRNQRSDLVVRETYLDWDAGDFDFRIGRQHAVWGEMVGLFFADVVSAKDMREYILPEFDAMRIPQWAVRAEYFRSNAHAELLWIPVPSYDEIGRPGAEFYPYAPPPPPGYAVTYRDELRPTREIGHSNAGLRLTTLAGGWDLSAFVYHSYDSAPTFYREIDAAPLPTFVYQARHDRIHQAGGTVAKDVGWGVLKTEAVYTRGRKFNVQSLSVPDGLVAQNTLDWAVGLDLTPVADSRFDLQYFQRRFYRYEPGIYFREHENGYSILASKKFGDSVEAQVTWIAAVNRTDWLLRPRLTWNINGHWRVLGGYDRFRGPPLGMFGRFDLNDRGYAEVRYSF